MKSISAAIVFLAAPVWIMAFTKVPIDSPVGLIFSLIGLAALVVWVIQIRNPER